MKWYRLAAEQGDVFAQSKLGLMYYHGHGVPQDDVMAHKWLGLTAANIRSDTKFREARVTIRDHVASRITPAKIAEAQRLAREWKPKDLSR